MDGIAPRRMRWWGWRIHALCCGLGALLLCLPACTWDGNFTLFGYSTKPMYDCQYKTVRVPIFKNKTFWAVTPIPGMEMNLTEEVVRAIQARTPYRVVGANEPADTELQGTIVALAKGVINYNQNYEVREGELTLTCQLNWVDLRTGQPITRPGRRAFDPILPDPLSPVGTVSPTQQVFNQTPIAATPTPNNNSTLNVPQPANNLGTPGMLGNFTPSAPLSGAPGGVAGVGVLIRAVSDYRVELGQTTASAQDSLYKNMAVRVTEMMESPW